MLGPMQISWTPVADRVWYTTVDPDQANVVCIAGDDRAMLIDAGGTPDVGAAVLASARELAGVPLEHVVITHHHADHWHGLAGMEDVESIAHENILSDDTPDEIRPTAPFSLARALELGNRFLEIVHFGPAHSQSDVMVVAQSAGVICVGDLLESAGDPQFDETTEFDRWPRTIDAVVGNAKADTIFVPGHGAPMDRDAAFQQIGDIAMFASTVENLIRQGVKLDDAYDSVDDWVFTEETVKAALPLAYKEYGVKGLEPKTHLPIMGV